MNGFANVEQRVRVQMKQASFGRAALLVAVALIHLAALYSLIHARSRPTLDGPPLFSRASSSNPNFVQLRPVKSRPYIPTTVEEPKNNVKAWRFPPATIWPITGEPTPTPSEFSPFMDLEPTADQIRPTPIRAGSAEAAALKADEPRMIVWMRPAYPLEWASDGSGRTITLAFHISSTGYPSDIRVEQSSGSQRLDTAALLASRSWRFSPAKWQGRPIESEAAAAITFNF